MHSLRPRLSNPVRFSFKFCKNCTRQLSQQAQGPLETENDWTDFQQTRTSLKTLMDAMSQYGSTQTSQWSLRDSLHRPTKDATLSALLASGAHFGHASSRMNPNFLPYAYGTRAGITLIDLDHTLPLLRRAAKVVRAVAANDGQIVFIGTRADIRPVVQKAAQRLGTQGFHVGDRWLPGTLTNKWQMFGHETVRSKRIVPDLVILLNPIQNMNAIQECALSNVPTIAIVDSNVDPRIVMYPIPANDESPRTAEIIAGVLSIAGREGIAIREAETQRMRMAVDSAWEDFNKMQVMQDARQPQRSDAEAFDY
ncbi:ribosomal protein S2, flavodoxin-like domain-containing protein [Lentinula edodes]|uniref:ribosomal protein S2, flavodoxin-like domain-containing protein n=1 Tax=Lentinula edodes TaxID=5353 RepID=UPI001E8EAB29|nr:ribosomal protein S2, flavodoxin-like domain-containing protein [Lentinula edodes]KAH7877619.1 ribosomal protein S2, flavodoxin-like domain-containing protein [Lentinula edodes]KAJ3914438.1 ribosomal protein S2, flavodoxin-like domain-containing protein [Lentinula edodes]